jgi:predicted RNA binding protein YcfA (HicA-like mRNA interferase family)
MRAGFYVHHQEGSHIAPRSFSDESLRVVVPANRKDLKKGTLKNIINQSGMTAEEFIEMLKV